MFHGDLVEWARGNSSCELLKGQDAVAVVNHTNRAQSDVMPLARRGVVVGANGGDWIPVFVERRHEPPRFTLGHIATFEVSQDSPYFVNLNPVAVAPRELSRVLATHSLASCDSQAIFVQIEAVECAQDFQLRL